MMPGGQQRQYPESRPGARFPDRELFQTGVGLAQGDPLSAGTAFYDLIKAVQEQTEAATALADRIRERELEQRSQANSRAVTYPFLYTPANGPRTFNLGKLLKQRVNALSLVTKPAAAALGADPRDSIIFVNFDYDLHVPQATSAAFPRAEYPPPDSFEILLGVGDKLNQFVSVRDMDSMTVYSRQAFYGTVFVTAGNPSVLPGL